MRILSSKTSREKYLKAVGITNLPNYEKTPKLTLTPTQTRTLGLGLSPGKTIGVQNLKPLQKMCIVKDYWGKTC